MSRDLGSKAVAPSPSAEVRIAACGGAVLAPDGRRLEKLCFAGFSARWFVRRGNNPDSWGELSFGWKDGQLLLARVERREELEPMVGALRERGLVVVEG